MASNIFARYVWLIDTVRKHKRITYEKINELWKECELNNGEDLPLRTFHNHRKAIGEIFDINIECDIKDGYRYYIDNPKLLEKDKLRTWMLDSYTALNQIKTDNSLKDRIRFEINPGGRQHLTSLVDAMRKDRIIRITYTKFGTGTRHEYVFEPYFLKVFNRRWYLIGKDNKTGSIKTLGLDRIEKMRTTTRCFNIPGNFSIDEFYEGCYGIVADKSVPTEKIIIKAWNPAYELLDSLPLHPSQKEIARDEESVTFELDVRPSFDLIHTLIGYGNHIEVLGPESIREKMRENARKILEMYKS